MQIRCQKLSVACRFAARVSQWHSDSLPESRSRIQIRCQSLPIAFRFAARISQWHSDSLPESLSSMQIRCQSLPVAFRFAARISQLHSDSLPDSMPDWRDTRCSRRGSRRPWHDVIIGSSESRVSLSALPTWSWHASIVLLVRPCGRTPDYITKQRIWVGCVPG